MRTCYRCLLWMHPAVFRREYGNEMLWIFDQTAGSQGASALFVDGLGSLARQWVLRSGWWRVVLALGLAVFQMVFGGMAALTFGRRSVAAVQDPSTLSVAEFAQQGPLAHQPLTIGIVMYLAVFVTGGLLVMVLGLTFWMRSFAVRRRALHRVI
jgi:hypothetical protein